jgi:hypothetical protein
VLGSRAFIERQRVSHCDTSAGEKLIATAIVFRERVENSHDTRGRSYQRGYRDEIRSVRNEAIAHSHQ